MRTFEQLSPDEKKVVEETAFTWMSDNQVYVDLMVSRTQVGVAPEEDRFLQPDQWKDIHWKWFYRSILNVK